MPPSILREGKPLASAFHPCLNPDFSSVVQRASPKSHHVGPQSRVGHFKDDTAHVLVGEEIVSSELHFVEEPVCIEKEWVAAPTTEQAAVAGCRRHGFPPDRDRCCLDDDFAVVAHPGSSFTLTTAKCRSLLPVFGRGELHVVGDVG